MDELETQFSDYVPGEVGLDEILKYPMAMREYEHRMERLAPALSPLLFGADTISFLMDLAARFDLDVYQIRVISTLIRDISLGASYLGDLMVNLQSKCSLAEADARSIANDLINILFKAYMQDIKRIQLEMFRDRIARQQVPGQPMPSAQPLTPPPPPPRSPVPQTDNTINLRDETNTQQ